MDASYRGWRRPGPVPPGGVEAEEGETLDVLCGWFRIFQYAKGHRYSTDDVLTAWYGTTHAPRVDRAADLGSGIGSVALISAWRLPGATFHTVEAQEISLRLARKSVQYNGLASRFTLHHGDLRDDVLRDEAPFDLVTGSPPYWPSGTASEANHPQAIPARIEVRGSVADYAQAASKILAPGGIFAFVFPTAQLARALTAIDDAELKLIRRRDIIFKEGETPLITLFAASRRGDVPATYEAFIEPPLTIRTKDGGVDPEYSAIRLSFGFPPGNVPASPPDRESPESPSTPTARDDAAARG
jgi:tRNA1(Val) A37 N6-methylase TrmN6